MPEKGLTLKVLFQAIDEMSGPLKTIGLAFDNVDRLTKQAAASARAYAAIGAVGVAAGAAGGRLLAQTQATAAAAAPIDEALTRLKQIAPAIDSARAAKDALNQVNQYGVASMQDEIDALARATQLYGKYEDAVSAVSAANRLALATHTPVIDALNQTAAMAKSSGQSIDQVSDKLAAMWKAAGGAGSLAQVERAWGMAKSHGETLEHFLAVMAEAQKAGVSGRSLSTYYEETSKGGGASHWSQGTGAIHALLDKQSADIAAIEAQVRASEGVSASLAATVGASPTSKVAREQQVAAAAAAVQGSGLLQQKGTIDSWITSWKSWEAEFGLGHQKVVTAYQDLKVGGGYLGEFALDAVKLLGAVKGLELIFPSFVGAALKLAAGLGEPAATLAAPLAVAGAFGATPMARRAGMGMVLPVNFHTPLPAATATAAATAAIVVNNSPTMNVTVAGGADGGTPEKTAAAVKAALDRHDSELEGKLRTAVDRARVRGERSAF